METVAETRDGAPVSAAGRRKGRLTLWALILVCTLPVAASYFAYYVWQPEARMNFGTLVTPTPLPASTLVDVDGAAVDAAAFTGAWRYLVVAPAACDDACRQALYLTRQVRTAQAEDAERVARVWLLPDAGRPDAALLDAHPGLQVVVADAAWRERFGADPLPRVWLVDPAGNVMMRYPDALEPKRMIKDLARLLKYSQQG